MSFSSATYWEQRYRNGGASGAGSRGHLAAYKAATINALLDANGVRSVLDFGCGDGHLLGSLAVVSYTGVDVSETILARCAATFPQHRFFADHALPADASAELTLSIDVIYHLVEDALYDRYMHRLFTSAERFVLIYASNADANWPSAHVRHRRFSDHPAARDLAWRLAAHLPNPSPFDPARPDDTSFADFYLYARAGIDVMAPAIASRDLTSCSSIARTAAS